MKKLFFTLIALMLLSNLHAEDIITKYNRGIFGYKTVHQAQQPIGRSLTCTDPGKLKCEWSSSLSSNNDRYESILLKVDEECMNGSSSGSFQTSDYYVSYTFDRDADKQEVHIYTLVEARDKGLI
nr:hypothetical protein [uncultured Fluviicola sp.]